MKRLLCLVSSVLFTVFRFILINCYDLDDTGQDALALAAKLLQEIFTCRVIRYFSFWQGKYTTSQQPSGYSGVCAMLMLLRVILFVMSNKHRRNLRACQIQTIRINDELKHDIIVSEFIPEWIKKCLLSRVLYAVLLGMGMLRQLLCCVETCTLLKQMYWYHPKVH